MTRDKRKRGEAQMLGWKTRRANERSLRVEIERLTAQVESERSRAIYLSRRAGEAEVELRAAMIAAVQEDYRAADGENAWRLAFFRVKGILRRALEPKQP